MPRVFQTHNTKTGSRLARGGICNGMTAAWARISLQNDGCSAKHKKWVESEGLMLATRVRLSRTGELASDARGQWRNMLSNTGLTPTFRASEQFNAAGLANRLIGYGNITAYIVIRFDRGIHTIGARITGTTCDYFDPNIGLLRYGSQGQFRVAANPMMNLFPGWTNNKTHIWTLTY
jgi:hypothetical protein